MKRWAAVLTVYFFAPNCSLFATIYFFFSLDIDLSWQRSGLALIDHSFQRTVEILAISTVVYCWACLWSIVFGHSALWPQSVVACIGVVFSPKQLSIYLTRQTFACPYHAGKQLPCRRLYWRSESYSSWFLALTAAWRVGLCSDHFRAPYL